MTDAKEFGGDSISPVESASPRSLPAKHVSGSGVGKDLGARVAMNTERQAWLDRQEERHEARIAILHNGPLGEWEKRREQADKEHPRTPTHRIHYRPNFTIEIEIAPWEDADEVIAQFVADWNDNLPEAGESWTEAGQGDTVDLEVENTGSEHIWEEVV